jgi:hypothetical protein
MIMALPETQEIFPSPRQKGRYNLYDTPDGGIHVSYTVEGSEEIQHIEIPGRIIQMAKMLEDGKMGPAQVLKALKGMAGGK